MIHEINHIIWLVKTHKLEALLLTNVVCFVLFWIDKKLAIQRWFRIPEITLLLLCAVGGSVGGLLAAIKFRHKISKPPFMYKLYFIMFLQGLYVAYLLVQHYKYDIAWYML